MKHIGLFEGIGGFSLAAHWMGWETVAWCEWNEFGQKVLKYHFPNAIGHGDITKTDFTPYANKIDILTGGFPCQPYSMAGKRKGKEDERHLWPEMRRAIREIAPRYIVGENVLGLVNWNGGMVFDEVCADLEAEGYEVAPVVIPAAAVNAPHGRDRVWFIAKRTTADTDSTRNGQEHEFCSRRDLYKEWIDSSRLTPDTDSRTTGSSKTSGSVESNGGNGHLFTEQRRESPELNNRLHEFPRNVADTDSNGQHQRHSGDEINASQGGVNAQCDVEQGNVNGNTTNSEREGLFGMYKNREKNNVYRENTKLRRGTPRYNKENDWQNFPTQSPVCGGNDGLPRQLDGITFSKWRAESIKAYGNAIVPQVAYEIFKSIAAHESQPLP